MGPGEWLHGGYVKFYFLILPPKLGQESQSGASQFLVPWLTHIPHEERVFSSCLCFADLDDFILSGLKVRLWNINLVLGSCVHHG